MRCILLILLFTYSINTLAQHFGTGLIFDDAKYLATPKKARLTRGDYDALPRSFSLKKYAPTPGNQLQLNTSAAWASAYGAHTILEAKNLKIEDKMEIRKISFSAAFTYGLVKDASDRSCSSGSTLNDVLESLKSTGSVKYTDFLEFCPDRVPESLKIQAAQNRITDYSRLYDGNEDQDFKIKTIKKAIFEGFPVVVGMHVPRSFDIAQEFWQPREQFSKDFPGHALTVVGYDDNKFGGAIEVLNSWGKDWGNDGYIWIRYSDFVEFNRYAFEVYKVPQDASGTDLGGELTLQLDTGYDMIAQLISDQGYYKILQPYPTGTKFRIYISNNETAYVYAIASDLTNAVGKIFPLDEATSPVLPYKSNRVSIPGDDVFIQMQDPPGKDFLCVIYSKEELRLDRIIKKIESTSGDFRSRVMAALGSDLLDPEDIKYDSSKMKFTGKSNGKTIVTIIVEIDHI